MSIPITPTIYGISSFEELFLNEMNSIKSNNSITKNASNSSDSIASKLSVEKESIQNLFDKVYSEGGYDKCLSFGKEFRDGLLDKDINEVIDYTNIKQITGKVMEHVATSTGLVDMLKTIDIPKEEPKNDKAAVVSVWQSAKDAVGKNISVLGSIFGSVIEEIWGFIQNYPIVLAIGYAMWKLAKRFGRHLAKISKLLKMIPVVGMVIDIALAVKNIYYIQKELVSEEWNSTMQEVGEESLMISKFDFKPEINYPNAMARVIGDSIENLTEHLVGAFSMGMVATKCLGFGFITPPRFNAKLEQMEKDFLSGKMSSNEFGRQVAFHIKASRKIKIVCSEMIGLICNVASAIFDLATGTGVGIVVTIIGNLVIAGIDMAAREGIIQSCKAFEDFWLKKLSDYQTMLIIYQNFVNNSHNKISLKSNKDSIEEGLKEIEDKIVSKEEISQQSDKALEDGKDEIMGKKKQPA